MSPNYEQLYEKMSCEQKPTVTAAAAEILEGTWALCRMLDNLKMLRLRNQCSKFDPSSTMFIVISHVQTNSIAIFGSNRNISLRCTLFLPFLQHKCIYGTHVVILTSV